MFISLSERICAVPSCMNVNAHVCMSVQWFEVCAIVYIASSRVLLALKQTLKLGIIYMNVDRYSDH